MHWCTCMGLPGCTIGSRSLSLHVRRGRCSGEPWFATAFRVHGRRAFRGRMSGSHSGCKRVLSPHTPVGSGHSRCGWYRWTSLGAQFWPQQQDPPCFRCSVVPIPWSDFVQLLSSAFHRSLQHRQLHSAYAAERCSYSLAPGRHGLSVRCLCANCDPSRAIVVHVG